MDNSPDSNKASNPDSNLDNKANKEKVRKDNSRDKRASAVNRVNRVKARVKDKMVRKVVSSRANRKVVGNRPAVHRMEASRSERANAVALLMVDRKAMAGVTIGSYPPRSVSASPKRRTCDASGAVPTWGTDSTTSSTSSSASRMAGWKVMLPRRLT